MLVRLDIVMRMEKNGVILSFHVSHISIFGTPRRRHTLRPFPER
jgi:hypothetical protein